MQDLRMPQLSSSLTGQYPRKGRHYKSVISRRVSKNRTTVIGAW